MSLVASANDKSSSDNEIRSKDEKLSNTFFTAMNISNLIVGSGIIGLAKAISLAGVLVGSVLLTLSALFAHFTIMALAKATALIDIMTYEAVIENAVGKWGKYLVSFLRGFYSLIAVTSYAIVIYDNVQDIIANFVEPVNGFDARIYLTAVVFGLVFPLSCFKTLAFLEKVSFLSIVMVYFYFFVVFVKLFIQPRDMFFHPDFFVVANKDIVSAIGIIAFALSCHHCVVPLFKSIKKLSVRSIGYATNGAIILCTCLYQIIAIFGYLTFAGNPSGNLLIDYCASDIVALAARVVFTITVVTTMPLQVITCRDVIRVYLPGKLASNAAVRILLALVLCVVAFLISISFQQISILFSLSGAVVAAPTVFILPSYGLLKAMNQGLRPNTITKVFCYVVIAFGCGVLVIGTIMSIKELTLTNYSPPKYYCPENIRSVKFSSSQFQIMTSVLSEVWK